MTINVPPQSSVAAKVTQLGVIYLNMPPIDKKFAGVLCDIHSLTPI